MNTNREDKVAETEGGFGGLPKAAVGGGATEGVEAAERHGGGGGGGAVEGGERGEVGGDNGFPQMVRGHGNSP